MEKKVALTLGGVYEDCLANLPGEWPIRRRMACESSLLEPSSTLPNVTTGGAIEQPSQDGASTVMWLAVLLTLGFLVYWFVVRRFARPAPQIRDSEIDLEAGLPREVLPPTVRVD